MVNIPQMNTFSLGNVLGQGEQIKGSRIRNQLGMLALEQQQEAAENRKKVKAARQLHANAADAITQLRADGDEEAADALRESVRAQYKSTIDIVNGMQGWVTNQESYDLVRSSLLQKGIIEPEEMPVDYDSSFFKKQVKEVKRKLSTFERTVGVDDKGVRQQEQITQDEYGNVLAVSPQYGNRQDLEAQRRAKTEAEHLALARRREGRLAAKDARKASEEDIPGLKPSVSNAIRAQTASMLESVFDINTGQIQFKDDATRRKAQQIMERAEQMLLSGQKPSVATAVVEAARTLGVAIPRSAAALGAPAGPAAANSDDPLRRFE